jgi:hypothetical protein
MMTNTLTAILNEKDVENLYRQYLTKKFGDMVFNSPFGCDGYGESKKHNVRLLCEFKDDLDLTTKVNQVKVLSQALYYIKKFEVSGKILPSVILIGDRNECFAIHTNEIFNYLGMDFNWNLAPSNAHTNVELVNLMIKDSRINPHVFNIKDIDNCINKIKDLTDGVKRFIPITPHNVTEVFKYFEDNVIGKHNLDTNQMANLFVQLLVNPDENYLHPVIRRKTVVTKAFHEVNLKSREVFESFFSHFSRDYTPEQRTHLTAVVDRLVFDVIRRKQGEFFTPQIWADKAHEFISSVFGDNWKETNIVWDPAWGTGNLTRGYKFKELYTSTLNYSDIQTAEQMGYNPEATKFQSDFLNDDYNLLPEKLRMDIESGKDMLILFNPPYATANNLGTEEGDHKGGVAKTEINKLMLEDKWGNSSQNLYAQFLYRVTQLQKINKNIKIAVFCPPLFLSGSSFNKFRENFFKFFGFKKGFLFEASNFSDVANGWGISFSIFDNVPNDNKFEFDLIEENKEFNLDTIGKKIIFNTDSTVPASKWVREEIKKLPTHDAPQLSTATNVKQKGVGNIVDGSLAYMVSVANSVYKNVTDVFMVSSTSSMGHGFSVTKDNFFKTTSLFTARKTITPTWVNCKDEYLVPNEFHDGYNEFKVDSLIFSLFNNSSNQSSLRQIIYKGEQYNINNNFFWMSKNEMTELANQNNYTELYNDARTDSDRYVHTLLFGEEDIYNQLSDDAKDVLDSSTNLVRLSLGMRRNFADDTNHLNSWDAGYAQLKLLWKEYYPEQFKEFRAKYKVLEEKMRPMVYELGFLLK